MAIEREPTQYVFRDQLAFALLAYGLRDQALEVVFESARVQPHFEMHAYTNLRPLPDDVVDAFAEGARSALGQTPLLPRVVHLLALGRLELRRGNARQAEQDLRAALEMPGTALNRADAHFRLGQSLQAQVRYDEAIEVYLEAEENPIFEPLGLFQRARIAEDRDELEQALKMLRRARRLRPANVEYALSYARIAEEFGKPSWAEEALRWARTKHPENPRALRALVELLLRQGDRVGADEIREELERLQGIPPGPPPSASEEKNL
jgi:tetratricopeptide (TPR) repeat protein